MEYKNILDYPHQPIIFLETSLEMLGPNQEKRAWLADVITCSKSDQWDSIKPEYQMC